MNKQVEIWKDIPGFEGRYQISSFGRVKSLSHRDYLGRQYKEKILKQAINMNGYRCVRLYKDGLNYTKKIHRLISEAFIPPVYGKNIVNHKDGNKQNNALDNLEWCTHSENNIHALKTGLNSIYPAVNKRAETGKKPIEQLDLNGNSIAQFPSASDAARLMGIDRGAISACCNGRLGSYKSFRWKFIEFKGE